MAKNELEKKALKDKDFPLAFPNLEAIEASELTPDEQLREKVKHLSMQLFGIAVDLANQQRKYNDVEKRIDERNKEILHLRSLLAQRNDYIRKYCKGLKALKKQLKDLQAGVISQEPVASVSTDNASTKTPAQAKKPKRINDLTTEERQAIQADYYEKYIVRLKQQVQYWKSKASNLQSIVDVSKVKNEDNPK